MKKSLVFQEILEEAGIKLDPYDCGRFKDRPVRLVDGSWFQIGERKETFDRWANSVESEFDIGRPAELRQLRRWLSKNI